MTQTPQRICILGGGFGGLYTALKLDEKAWDTDRPVEIVLVDREDRFVFLPLLYELLSDELESWEIAPPFVDLLAETRVRFVRAGVDSVDVEARQVALSDGQTLSYDRLVLALGGETPTQSIPGVDAHTYAFRTLDDAYRLKDKLRALEDSDKDRLRVAIVGGGYSGVELACTLADRLGGRGRIRVIDRNEALLSNSSKFNREAARQALDDRDIWVDYETEIESVGEDSIDLKYRDRVDTIPVDLVLWTVGTTVAPAIESLPLAKSDRGQLLVETTLQAKDRPEVFALGDLADCFDADGQKVPTTAQAAFQQADYTAWNIWASLSDRPMLPFRYQNLGEMMTLGSENATLSGLGVTLDGGLAHLARRLVYLYRLPTPKHQLNVGLNWIAKPFQDLLASFE